MAKKSFRVFVRHGLKNHNEYMCGGDNLLESLEFLISSPVRKDLKTATALYMIPDDE